MVVPALIFYAFNLGEPTASGWGIPMATDIAFALGALSLFSKRVPFGLKIFLLTLAIIDDLGAIIVIAFFYSSKISQDFLAISIALVFLIFLISKSGIQSFLFYGVLGFVFWFCTYKSGVHATIAGVVLGLLTPARPLKPQKAPPTEVLIEFFHPLVIYIVMPIFAFFNAGITFSSFSAVEVVSSSVFLGVFFGLFLGKPIGVILASWMTVKLNIGSLPAKTNWIHILGVGFLAGIGFTMSLFISHLSIADSPTLEMYSKISILTASVFAAIAGSLILLKQKKVV